MLLLMSLALAGPLQDVLATELERSQAALSERDDAPYYIALAAQDGQHSALKARYGTVMSQRTYHSRLLDVDLRVGSPTLDSTHELRGFSSLDGDSRDVVDLPLDDDPAVLAHAVWRELDSAYRDATERVQLVRANQQVMVEEEAPAPDFQADLPPQQATVEGEAVRVDLDLWEPVLVSLSQQLESDPWVLDASVDLGVQDIVKVFVDSDGSRIEQRHTHARLSLHAQTTAEDGDVVGVFEAMDVRDPADLPPAEALRDLTQRIAERVRALQEAPRGEPYSGPVLLLGEASGVFFHEVLGHRVEGHRQKREDEGHTFADHVGRPVLPDWIDVYDDPRVEHLAGHDLNGFYRYDDEGQPSQRADLIVDGRFTGFLMGRSPIPGFDRSNGHGRRAAGNPPVSRMGNTIVEAQGGVPLDTLRQRLREEAREQGLEYGMMVEAIDGGFTLTGRQMPNAFNVRASATWRVFVDGRPDELVRGIDLVGTPFGAFSSLIAAGDEQAVFNGFCGAESGWVPVSAVAPPLLFERLEFQLKEKGQDRPPLLPKPDAHLRDGGDS